MVQNYDTEYVKYFQVLTLSCPVSQSSQAIETGLIDRA